MTPEEEKQLRQDLVDTTNRLVEFPTMGNHHEDIEQCCVWVRKFFKDTPSILIKDFIIAEKPAMFISFNKRKKQSLILNCHLDVVDGFDSQFKPYVEKGKLYGRGTVDMKASVAAMLHLMRKLSRMKRPPAVGLMIVTDEETTGLQTKALLKKGYKADLAIVGEPTRMQVETRHKGHLTLRLTAYGSAGHGSRPWQGKNAIIKLWNQYQKLIDEIPQAKRSRKWLPTINPTSIIAESPPNVTPSKAEMVLDIRTTEDYTNDTFYALLRKHKIKYKTIASASMLTNPRRNNIRTFKLYAQRVLGRRVKYVKSCGGSDAKSFSDKGMQAFNFGPIGKGHHKHVEYVEIRSLMEYYQVLEGYVRNYLVK